MSYPSRKITRYGELHEGGGCLFVAIGFPPHARLKWTLTGNGRLRPRGLGPGTSGGEFTNANGTAMARYDCAGAPHEMGPPDPSAVSGDSITVTAEAHDDA